VPARQYRARYLEASGWADNGLQSSVELRSPLLDPKNIPFIKDWRLSVFYDSAALWVNQPLPARKPRSPWLGRSRHAFQHAGYAERFARCRISAGQRQHDAGRRSLSPFSFFGRTVTMTMTLSRQTVLRWLLCAIFAAVIFSPQQAQAWWNGDCPIVPKSVSPPAAARASGCRFWSAA